MNSNRRCAGLNVVTALMRFALVAAWLLPRSARAMDAQPELAGVALPVILALLAGGVVLSIALATLAWRRNRQAPPPLVTGVSLEELQEMRRTVSAFATLLRDGSAALMRSNTETLESANQLAAHGEQLIALLAGAEARVTNAAERSEILATRVAKSAAAEIKSAVKNLADISARIERQSVTQGSAQSPG